MLDNKTKRIILRKIGALVENKAKRLVPVDLGHLRASIQHRIEGDEVIIFTSLPHAEDMEYGKPPSTLDENEKQDLTEWAYRHNLPPKAIIRSIEKKGIEVGSVENPLLTEGGTYRPFLRPALFQSLPEIKKLIAMELNA